MTLVLPIKVRVEGTSRPAKLNAPIPVTPEMMIMIMMLVMDDDDDDDDEYDDDNDDDNDDEDDVSDG